MNRIENTFGAGYRSGAKFAYEDALELLEIFDDVKQVKEMLERRVKWVEERMTNDN